MMKMMKALGFFEDAKDKLEIREVPVPEIGNDDILLEVKAAGICGGDLHFYSGEFPIANIVNIKFPIILGHEFTGVIAKIGKNVDKRWNIGDRVVSENTGYACGVCPSCSQGNFVNCPQRKTIGFQVNGAFANYVRIPGNILKTYPNCLLRLPENIGFIEAPCLEVTANTYKALIQEANFHSGESVVIFGAGSMALMAVQHAKIAGAVNIIIVGLSSDKKVRFNIAKQFGATHIIASDEETDLISHIQEIVGPNGVSTVLDVVGLPSVTEKAIQIVRNEGTVVLIGDSNKPYDYSLRTIARKSVTFRGHMGYNAESWRNSIALVKGGLFDLKPLVTHVLPLEKFCEGFEMMLNQDAGKVILVP